ncbi:hypothetical protein F2Q69_00040997 [Brassica cretica]|uniref:Uncharacterized protein n=1 Tax=Brassica cretica TaxID=69181 RepID=A0A8S9NLP0_BRACR|nr:hypothetical protein F2Q69_00040997 [Brassica cretica]
MHVLASETAQIVGIGVNAQVDTELPRSLAKIEGIHVPKAALPEAVAPGLDARVVNAGKVAEQAFTSDAPARDPDCKRTVRDPIAISSRDFSLNPFVLPFATTLSSRLGQHRASSRPFRVQLEIQCVPIFFKTLIRTRQTRRYRRTRRTLHSIASCIQSQPQLASVSAPARDPDCKRTVRDPIAISSRDFSLNPFVLPFATTLSSRLDQHRASSRPVRVQLEVHSWWSGFYN